MRLAWRLAALVALGLSIAPDPVPVAAAGCQFVLGFRAIHVMIPDRVGDCLVDEHHNPDNGDGLQETTAWHGKGGLLVWRKADNWTAFTDGSTTWVNGPNGLQQRPNDVRFDWEHDGATAPPAPATTVSPRTHDWRADGYVGAVGGQLYDPRCVPLRSIGSNVPNLPYRDGLVANLDWLRSHNLRWVRVFATGHALPEIAPRSADQAIAALRSLLSRVDEYNAQHDPAEAIYVLVSLTDYYPPGVPGDRHGFDHPVFAGTPVLPAPWYRQGVSRFDFLQEHNAGRLTGLPNYEQHYLPWVRQIVPQLATSRSLLGWQLGNELKARGSPPNGISSDQAHEWYLGFTRDVVDTIRAHDRNHLVFMGAQYVAELVDWEYRPKDQLDPSRVARYRSLVQRMLDDCGAYCWNVWGLTAYDLNPYPLDDAETFGANGVAVVATEFAFTWDVPDKMMASFGGDRARAIRSGVERAWQTVDGQSRLGLPGVTGLFETTQLDGIAPWASPAPGALEQYDTDGNRGITGAPDASAVWAAWTEAAAARESANRAAGQSAACLASP